MSLRLTTSGSETKTRIGSAKAEGLASLSRISKKELNGRFQPAVKNKLASSATNTRYCLLLDVLLIALCGKTQGSIEELVQQAQ